MHVRFACNLTVNPLYPKPCLFTPPHQFNNVPALAGKMPVNSEVCFSHQMSERRIGGGLPLKNETPASGSAVHGDNKVLWRRIRLDYLHPCMLNPLPHLR